MDTPDIYVTGIGIHPFGRFDDKSYLDLGRDAAEMALADAGLAWRDVEAAYLSAMYLPATSGPRILKQLGATGIPICDVEAACASGGVALMQALFGIRAGAFEVALVVGVEKMPRGFMDPSMIYEPWQIRMGLSINPAYWAMRARRHMHEFGTTEVQIARIAEKNHANSVSNANAMYRRRFALDEIMNSPLICDPIRLYEICAPNDGAAAVIVTSRRKVKQRSRAVAVSACIHTIGEYSADLRAPAEAMSARVNPKGPTEVAARRAYEAAGFGPEDIACFEVQDTDAFCEIELYEHLGLCPEGEGGRLIDVGATHLNGRAPVNMSGGLISKGEPVGASHLAQIVEIVGQLRGEAGSRQVKAARTGLAHVLGAGNHCAVTILQI